MSVFKRGSQSVKDGARPAPMTWDYSIRYTKPGGFFACRSDKWLVDATCRNGHTCVLSLDVHRIADNGQIWPSYVCPVKGCTFHEFVLLEGWDANHVYETMEI